MRGKTKRDMQVLGERDVQVLKCALIRKSIPDPPKNLLLSEKI